MAAASDERETVSTLYRVWCTVIEMLEERGYVVDPEQKELTKKKEHFVAKFGETAARAEMQILTSRRNAIRDNIIVFFLASEDAKKKLGVKPIRTAVEKMEAASVRHGIIVSNIALTPYATNIVTAMRRDEFVLEVFLEEELCVNITKHELVPKHQVLSEAEKKTVLQKYKLTDNQLPRMQQTDPVARFYGLRRGQLVKIIRQSETAGRYVTYRIVI